MQNLDVLSQFNLTLAQVYSYMWQFCTTTPCAPLSSAFLAELDAGFALARGAGIKLLVRFCYENSSAYPKNGPSTYEEIFGHMRQLQPVVARNADVIHTIAAGFVGAYGEWHSSVHHLEENHSALALLVQHELDWFLPPDRSVIIRTPTQKASILRTWPGSSSTSSPNFGWCIASAQVNRSQACMRLGFDNDGFGAGNSDGGTWATPYPPYGAADKETGVSLPYNLPGNPEFDYMTREAPFVLVDGEPYAHNKGCSPSNHTQPMCSFTPKGPDGRGHEAGSQAAVRLREHHYTSFSFARNCAYLTAEGKACETKYALDYWRNTTMASDIVNHWHLPHSPAYPVYSTSYLQYLADHLGYRLELTSASTPSSVTAGGALQVNVTLVNRGFAAPVNPRSVLVVLVPASNGTAAAIATGTAAEVAAAAGALGASNADALDAGNAGALDAGNAGALDAGNADALDAGNAGALDAGNAGALDAGNVAPPVSLGTISTDVRLWQPYLPGDPYFHPIEHVLSFDIAELPAAVTAGKWRVGLYLPDSRAEAHGSEARFAIRFANDGSSVGWWTAPGGTAARYGVNTFADLDVVG
jgi:hypothetical protein